MSNNTNFTSFSDKDWTVHVSEVENNIESIHVSQDEPDDATTQRDDAAIADHIAQYIDHTQLKTDATLAQIDQLCEEAQEYGFKVSTVRSRYSPT